MSTARSPVRHRIALALGATLVALLAGEVFCRVMVHLENQDSLEVAFTKIRPHVEGRRVAMIDIIRLSPNDRIIFELKPDIPGLPFKGAPFTTNSYGFRAPEMDPEPGPDTVTIVGLGDSVMFGYGVPDGQDYLSRLEVMLNKRHPEKTWRCINTAVPAYNTVQEVETLKTKALAFQPDLVILGLVTNDLGLPPYFRFEEDVFDLSRSFLWERCLRGTRWAARRNGFKLETGRDTRLSAHGGFTSMDEVPPRHRSVVGWDNFVLALDELQALSEEHGFTVVSFTNTEDDVVVRMIGRAKAQGWLHVSLFPEIQAYLEKHHGGTFSAEDPSTYLASKLAVAPVDGHPSALQHLMAANKLLEELESNGVIARLKR
ncbi:MAG: SGNH/GDSL hydrolase family protein [Planctomycetota bacterium]|jgi:hypothetical protein